MVGQKDNKPIMPYDTEKKDVLSKDENLVEQENEIWDVPKFGTRKESSRDGSFFVHFWRRKENKMMIKIFRGVETSERTS